MLNLERSKIIKDAIPFEDCDTGVYFLIHNKEIVYVGRTTRGLARIFHHTQDKKFDSYFFLPVEADKLSHVEGHYILTLNPKYNKQQIQGYATIRTIKEIARVQNLPHKTRTIKKVILEKDIIHYTHSTGILYIPFTEVKQVLIYLSQIKE